MMSRTGVQLLLAMLALSVGAGRAQAEPLAFDFKDPKEISAVSLTLDSPLEPIVGYAKGLSGTVRFDPAAPLSSTGRIAVDVSSVQFSNEGYTATARGFALEGSKYPQVFFTLRKVLQVKRVSSNLYTGLVRADFVCKGITLPLTVPLSASYFPGRAEERTNGKYRGDILVIRTAFDVSRSRLGISEGIPASMVGDKVRVGVAVVGIHYASGSDRPEAAPTAVKPTRATSVWKVEAEERDDPVKVDAEFGLNSDKPSANFRTAAGALRAENVRFAGGKMTFNLPDNPLVGPRQGEATFTDGTVRGQLRGKEGVLKFHGRPKQPSDDVKKELPADAPQGPGFRDLTIEADGKQWSLAERMKFYRVPAVSLARIENSRVVETGVFGVTSVETGEPARAETLFQAGGMGSPLVNLLALRLAALGKLDLKREANAYLTSAKIPENAETKARPVTVLDLMNGTSGLAQYKFTGYPPDRKAPTLAALMQGADPDEMEPLDVKAERNAPGNGGINTAILEQVISDALGRPFPEIMRDYLFVPFGMIRSVYDPLPYLNTPGGVALGHYSSGERMLDRYHNYPAQGESGLWTTAADFATALCQVQQMIAGKPNLLLSNGQKEWLTSVNGERILLGLIKSTKSEFLPEGYLYHGGDPYGYFANHATHLRNGYGVVVMQNRIMSWRLHNEIVQALARRHRWDAP